MGTSDMYKETFSALMEGMDAYLSSKTVVSEPIVIGDATLIPLVNISFGSAAGVLRRKDSANSAGGIGGKITPNSVIVIKDNSTRIINISTNTGIEKLIDMVPDIVDKISSKVNTKNVSPQEKADTKDSVNEIINETIKE